MMKKCFTLLIALMMPLWIFGDNYSQLWKRVSEANDKDLPKTAYELLQTIAQKATKEKAYGQLLKAELQAAQTMADISPDSLKPELLRMKQHGEAAKDEVLKLVYQTVLYRVSGSNSDFKLDIKKPDLSAAMCEKLAMTKDDSYTPLVIKGVDAAIFNHDLLHVIGFELDDYQALYDYYNKVGNRRAACIVAASLYRYADTAKIEAMIQTYKDLPEAGELAIVRYDRIGYGIEHAAERYNYIHQALNQWGKWPRMNYLRNEETKITNPQYRVAYDHQRVRPQQAQKVELKELRNLKTLSMTVYKVDANGDIEHRPDYEGGYKKIKPLLREVVCQEERTFNEHQPYEFFEDSLTLKGLPVGVYMIEFKSEPSTTVLRQLYFVSDVYTIAETQPSDEGVRYVVVNATTGQPIAGAHLRIKQSISYNNWKTYHGVTDAKGEYIFKEKVMNRRREVFAYTDTDKASPGLNGNSRYEYYDSQQEVTQTCLYTDRAIYRPGQTVHASALVYKVKNGIEQQVKEHTIVKFVLRDANYKVVAEQQVLTDAYGVCAADFTLPAKGLTGRFTIQANQQSHSIRVEEYKRPTFHVDFPEVKETYAAGDTLKVKGVAMSHAGVPVQSAKVSYTVKRRTAFWWWSYSRYWNTAILGYNNDGTEVFSGTAETQSDGSFEVEMPLEMPETSHPMFYTFVVTADVTDTAGETHSGQLSLPLGNRKQTLQVDMPEKVLLEEKPTATFHLYNAAGKDVEAKVSYRIDGGSWQKAKTNSQLSIFNSQLKSGKHTLEAICEGDTIQRDFVLFSLDDERPATETKDWFYQSTTQFTNDGKPVTIQVGSSDKDVHIVYSIFSGEQVIERGAVDRSNQLLNLKLSYKEAYGNGLLLTFAWVKEGVCYSHTAKIQRPLPNKQLTLQWSTFRDRLKPGQEETWTLNIKDANGKPVDAQMMATLYDKSLDQLQSHQWSLVPYLWLPLPSTSWLHLSDLSYSSIASKGWRAVDVNELRLSQFDESIFPEYIVRGYGRFASGMRLSRSANAVMDDGMVMMAKEAAPMAEEKAVAADVESEEEQPAETQQTEQVQMRENLDETAFFYPQLTTDEKGNLALKFTLPESLTTWRFMGIAHTKDMYYGKIEGEAVAQKDVMIQPNVPRFLRDGDQGTISARIYNIGEKDLSGKAVLKLMDAETNAIVLEQSQAVSLKAGETTAVSFNISPSAFPSLLICQMSISGSDFSDGEQHYLPILPSTEHVTVTVPITQHHAGTETIDLSQLIPADGKDGKLTFEYTNNPAWLMIQALPVVGRPCDDNAISQAASFYANSLGRYILAQNPNAKQVFALWKQEADQNSLTSALEKNQELKDLVLNETPWVMDADRETEQKQRLADFFDENLMKERLSSAVQKLEKLQRSDGSWSWWPDMPGSFYMTVAISEMLVRLNAMAGTVAETQDMLSSAFDFMGQEMVEEVKELKKWQKKGHTVSFPSFKALQWLYLATLDGRELPDDVKAANSYLLNLMKKDIKSQSIYEKALAAVILSKPEPKRAAEYVKSLKEYTVFREEMGRYYDTPRAGYSWYDYKIPTQTVAIEAIQRITPDDRQTIEEMQRWLLQEKRTQAWDTPINSVNAVYAFLNGGSLKLGEANAKVQVDAKPLDLPKATAAIGYVKTNVPAESKRLTIEKSTESTSWGAVYAQFVQPTRNIADTGSGFTIKREVIGEGRKVGDRIKIRITITADRDYDFVQVIDKRAACLEPVRQLSGYHNGAYCTPRDYTTNYYFDGLSKGEHVIENEYYIDRAGTYETGTCTVGCAYAPEFRATAHSQLLTISK